MKRVLCYEDSQGNLHKSIDECIQSDRDYIAEERWNCCDMMTSYGLATETWEDFRGWFNRNSSWLKPALGLKDITTEELMEGLRDEE